MLAEWSQKIVDPVSRRAMPDITESYERLARRAIVRGENRPARHRASGPRRPR
jgi:hypothetical protein